VDSIYARFNVVFLLHAVRPCKTLRGGFRQVKSYLEKISFAEKGNSTLGNFGAVTANGGSQ
jgi:hypothetical protein